MLSVTRSRAQAVAILAFFFSFLSVFALFPIQVAVASPFSCAAGSHCVSAASNASGSAAACALCPVGYACPGLVPARECNGSLLEDLPPAGFGDGGGGDGGGGAQLCGSGSFTALQGAVECTPCAAASASALFSLVLADAESNDIDIFGDGIGGSSGGSGSSAGIGEVVAGAGGVGAALVNAACSPLKITRLEAGSSHSNANNSFAIAIAVSAAGDWLLAGEYAGDENTPSGTDNSGAAYVFTRASGSLAWSYNQRLMAPNSSDEDHFGHAVALSADATCAVVGASDANSMQGAVYVFSRASGASSFSYSERLTSDPEQSGALFGQHLAISSDWLAVGAFGWNSSTGAAFMFSQSGSVWTQTQILSAHDGVVNDEFGHSAAMSSGGAIFATGAAKKDASQGQAYIFSRTGNTWAQQAAINASDGVAGDNFGSTVAVSGDAQVVAVGATGFNSSRGAVYVFTRSTLSWVQSAKVTPSPVPAFAGCGSSLSLTADGTRMAVGCLGLEVVSGRAYLFTRAAGSTSWAQELVATALGMPAEVDLFGTVALTASGTWLAVGADFATASNGASRAGAAFVAPACPAGTSTSTMLCMPCPEGNFADMVGSMSCELCPAGSFAATSGQASCELCPEGSYSDQGWSSCNQCSAGKFADTAGSAFCEECPAGTMSQVVGANSSAMCVECPAGWYSDMAASMSCMPCPIGSELPATGANSSALCELCPAGSFAATSGQASCELCPEGSYSDQGWSSCNQCSMGKFADTAGSAFCEECPAGTMSQVVGANSSAMCVECPAGWYSDMAASMSCMPCPIGSELPATGANSSALCELCPAGSFAATSGQASCELCPEGSYSDQGWSSCNQCSMGKFADTAGSAFCEECPAGTMSQVVGANSSATCVECPAGWYSEEGWSWCNQCSAGSFSTEGASNCSLCPAGTYSSASGTADNCSLCADGTSSSLGFTRCSNLTHTELFGDPLTWFGNSVAMNDWGSLLVVGANGAREALVYWRDDLTASWNYLQTLEGSATEASNFGSSVSISSDTGNGSLIFVGDDSTNEMFVFSFKGTNWTAIDSPIQGAGVGEIITTVEWSTDRTFLVTGVNPTQMATFIVSKDLTIVKAETFLGDTAALTYGASYLAIGSAATSAPSAALPRELHCARTHDRRRFRCYR
jgi:hypothetical protein